VSDPDPIAVKFLTTADTTGATQTSTAITAVKDSTAGVATAAQGAVSPVKAMANEIKAGGEEHASFHEKQHRTIEGLHMVAMMTSGEVKEGLHEGGLAMKLLGSFTGEMSMGVVGAALVIGQAIPMIVGHFTEAYKKSEEAAKKFAEENQKIAEKAAADYGSLVTLQMEDDHKAAEARAHNQSVLATVYRAEETAQSAAAIAALDNAAKLEAAEQLIAKALGIRIDKYKEIQALAEIELAKLRETEKKAQADGEAKIQLEVHENWLKTENMAIRDAELKKAEADLEMQKEILEELEKQRTSIEIAESKRSKSHFDPLAGVESKGAELELGRIGIQIEQGEGAVKAAFDAVKKLKQQTATDEADFKAMNAKITDDEKARHEESATLIANLAADTTVADLKKLDAEIKENLAGMKQVTGNVTQTTAMDRGSVNALLQLQSGETLTVQQIPQVVNALKMLAGSIQLGFATVHGTAADSLAMINQLQINLEKQRQDTARLKARIGVR